MKIGNAVAVSVLCITVAAVMTFQTTYLTLTKYYTHSVSSAELASSNSISAKLEEVADIYKNYYVGELDEEALITAALKGYVDGTGDIYGEYYTADEYKSFEENVSGEYKGLGITVTYPDDAKSVIVMGVTEGSPAEEAGVAIGDVITEVEGRSVDEIGYEAAVEIMTDSSIDPIKFSVLRDNNTLDFEITRGVVVTPSVDYVMTESENHSIGYIVISAFETNTPEQFISAVDSLTEDGAEALIFDVRGNPGGDLNSIITILDYLVPEGPIIRLVAKDGSETSIDSDENEINLPMVVLANGNTASAAELFTAALMDYDKAVFIGTKTYGKGSMQQIIPLSDGSAVKITVRKYNPPFSDNYDGIGITPDIELRLDMTAYEKGTDNQIARALEVLTEELDTATPATAFTPADTGSTVTPTDNK